MITQGKKSGLVTPIGKKRITLSDTTMFVEGLISRQINKSEARKMCNDIADDVIEMHILNATKIE